MLDLGVQGQMFVLGKAEWWDWRMRIVVAKEDLLSTFAIAKAKQTKVCEGRAIGKQGL